MKSFFALISFVLMIFFAVVMAVDKSVCTLPAETGPCRAGFQCYFHNHKAKECQIFIYGGCEGNDNRFETKEECEKMCKEEA